MSDSVKYTCGGDGRFLKWVAYLQIIGIVFVVLGHSFHEYPDGEMGHTTLLYRMMYSFRMPLFMFVSVFLMVYTTFSQGRCLPWRKFAQSKVKRLMVPFVVLSLITFVPRALLSGIADDPVVLDIRSLAGSLVISGRSVIPFFWFLQASFTLLLVNYAVLLFANRRGWNQAYVYSVLILGFTLLPFVPIGCGHVFALGDAIRLGVFFVLGAAYAHSYRSVDRVIRWTSFATVTFLAVCWIAAFFTTEGTDLSPLCSLLGIMMCVSVAKLLDRYSIGMLDHLIGANYIIFLLSWFCNVISQQVLRHYTDMPWWVYSILSLFSGIYVPWWFYRYLQRHPDGRVAYLATHFFGQSFRRR